MSGSRRGCLLFHGFTGGPYEVRPLAEYLRGEGWTCRVPELPGHDPDLRGLGRVTWRDWVQAAEEHGRAMEREFGSFDLVGFSMGGLLAAGLANRSRVRRLVLLSPALIPFSPARLTGDLVEAARAGRWSRFRSAKPIPFRSVLEFVKLTRRAAPEWRNVSAPAMIVQGERDQVVHPSGASVLERLVPSVRQVLMVPGAKHLICFDQKAGEIFAAIHRFLAETEGGNARD